MRKRLFLFDDSGAWAMSFSLDQPNAGRNNEATGRHDRDLLFIVFFLRRMPWLSNACDCVEPEDPEFRAFGLWRTWFQDRGTPI